MAIIRERKSYHWFWWHEKPSWTNNRTMRIAFKKKYKFRERISRSERLLIQRTEWSNNRVLQPLAL